MVNHVIHNHAAQYGCPRKGNDLFAAINEPPGFAKLFIARLCDLLACFDDSIRFLLAEERFLKLSVVV